MWTTQKSLIFRIRDLDDSRAWSNFVDIYGPLVYRYGRRRGLQDANAADLSQDVLREVATCIERFNYDKSLGKFRNWLMVIARYKLSHHVRRESKHAGTGDTATINLLEQQQADDDLSENWEAEYRNHLFHWASEQVRDEVTPQSWQAFWATAVDNKPVAQVASELAMQVGTVYVAKSRVLTRIRQKIASIDDTIDE